MEGTRSADALGVTRVLIRRQKDMRIIVALAALSFAALSLAQTRPFGNGVFKIPIRHGDPWAIKTLLQGMPLVSPEISTVLGFAGVPDQESTLLREFFGEGRLVVNPTDNSLYWFPGKIAK